VVSFPVEPIWFMTRIARRWFRFALLLMLAVSAQVPACEYGTRQNADGTTGGQAAAYRLSLTPPPSPAASHA
jgi:hypothetical protein